VNTIALNAYRRLLRQEPPSQILSEIKSKAGIDTAAIDIGRILKRCRPTDRKLLELQLRGATIEEVARQQGVTEIAARLRLLRARRAARRSVEVGSARQ
jgi:DNA-directed RNA polymerase specialized sigma24 family protein